MTDSPLAENSRKEVKSPKKTNFMDFDLFKFGKFEGLEQAVYFKGAKCKEIFEELVTDVCKEKSCSRWQLCKELSDFYESDLTTMQKFVYSKDYFPVYLVSKLISFLEKRMQGKYFSEFNGSVGYFKVGVSHGWLKFPRVVSAELAWLCGAVAADGWISKETNSPSERLGIIDFHKKILLKASAYFDKCFGFEPDVKRHLSENCWEIKFRSKPITKFFTTYLGFHYGIKVYDVCEPKVIKESKFRLDYASGVLSFDGSVEIDGVVSLGCASENLIRDVYSILTEEGLKVRFEKREMTSQTLFFVKSEGLLQHKDAQKWISIFGLDIEKGQRLDSLVNGFKEKCVSEEDALLRLKKFVNYSRKKECPIYKLFFTLKKEGSIKRQDLLQKTNLPHTTFYKYVWVLRKANMVSCYTGQFWRGFENTYKFNYNVTEWRVPMVS